MLIAARSIGVKLLDLLGDEPDAFGRWPQADTKAGRSRKRETISSRNPATPTFVE